MTTSVATVEPYELCVDFQITTNKKNLRILNVSDKKEMKSKRKEKTFKQHRSSSAYHKTPIPMITQNSKRFCVVA